LLKFLQEVGYEDIFNTDEVNEIKDLYEKAQTELTESIKQVNSLNTQKLEEKLLADQSFKRLINSGEKEESKAVEVDADLQAESAAD